MLKIRQIPITIFVVSALIALLEMAGKAYHLMPTGVFVLAKSRELNNRIITILRG
jgi:hypothetical protein